MTQWPVQRELTLAALPNASFWARRHAFEVLNEWELTPTELVRNAQLVVAELVTKAVKATGGLDEKAGATYAQEPLAVGYLTLRAAGFVQLRLSHGPGRLLIEVWDRSDEPPTEKLTDYESESGRGLLLVGAYCEKWGWYPVQGGGKVVWAEMKVDHSV